MSEPIVVSAPAKLILCGEHAVVYGQPAIAIPLPDVRAYATAAAGPAGSGLHFIAPDLDARWSLAAAPAHPLSELAAAVLTHLDLPAPDLTITLRSDIPIAGGMGSGAAIGSALVRALAGAGGRRLAPAQVAELVYASERRYHGTPSGIDNTVIAHECPIWFVRGSPPTLTPLSIGAPLHLLIGDTGVRSATHLPVAAVRARSQAAPEHFAALFAAIGDLAVQARASLSDGAIHALGPLLNQNQALLEDLGVSSPELGRLVAAARAAGAIGAKLSGAGWGGVMLALVTEALRGPVAAALQAAGAARVLTTTLVATF